MNRFTVPRDIYYGRGSISELSKLDAKRAVIVTGGSSMQKTGVLAKVEKFLRDGGAEVETIADVEPDPSVETVRRGADKMRGYNPDLIVGLGGGSPIDAAKVMWIFYEHPDADFNALITPFTTPKLRMKARFAAIPSTSGTATEVTAFAVVTDNDKGIKYPLADFEITPDVAILDPDIADTMPKPLTAYTGMDALTHSIEAYVSTAHTDFTDPLALAAISGVFEYLLASYEGDSTAREHMHYAQCLAGMAFSNALLGITHSMAHKTGAAFSTGHIPHGCLNAMYLPSVIEYNAGDGTAKARYAEIARKTKVVGEGTNVVSALGHEGKFAVDVSDEEAVGLLCEKIREMNRSFGIAASLREYGVSESEFKEKLPRIAADAVADACTGTNPRKIDEAAMRELFAKVYG